MWITFSIRRCISIVENALVVFFFVEKYIYKNIQIVEKLRLSTEFVDKTGLSTYSFWKMWITVLFKQFFRVLNFSFYKVKRRKTSKKQQKIVQKSSKMHVDNFCGNGCG